MSRHLKGKIFVTKSKKLYEDVAFYRVTRATTNTCELIGLEKNVIFQNEDHQFVEPGCRELVGNLSRCRVLGVDIIEFKSGEIATEWDGKPVKQPTFIFLFTY